MKSALLLTLVLAGGTAPAASDLPPVTLHVQSADARSILSGLAALANLEPAIAADVTGQVSIELDSVPFERALARIAAAAGLEARVDHGRLVAARKPPERDAAPDLPARFRGEPRVPASDYARALAETPPLFVTTDARRSRVCRAVLFDGRHPEAVSLGAMQLIQVAWDPVRRVRYLALDGGSAAARRAIAFDGPSRVVEIGDVWIALASSDPGRCETVRAHGPIGVLDSTEVPGPNAGAVLIRVAVEGESDMLPGWCLAEGSGGGSTHGATKSPGRGATRDWTLSSYVTADGTAAALVLGASAVWTDPADGREYRTTQYAASGFLPLAGEPVRALSLEPGPANTRAIALTAVRESDWATCASRAAAATRRDAAR